MNKKQLHSSALNFNNLTPEERREVLPKLNEYDKLYILDHAGFRGTKQVLIGKIYKLSKDQYGGCWASKDNLAKMCNVSKRQIQMLLKELVARGVLIARERYQDQENSNWQKTTLYSVNFALLIPPNRKVTAANRAARLKAHAAKIEQLEAEIVQLKAEIVELKSERTRYACAQEGVKSAAPPLTENCTPTPEVCCTPTPEVCCTGGMKSAAPNLSPAVFESVSSSESSITAAAPQRADSRHNAPHYKTGDKTEGGSLASTNGHAETTPDGYASGVFNAERVKAKMEEIFRKARG
jgi:hypothetical protein